MTRHTRAIANRIALTTWRSVLESVDDRIHRDAAQVGFFAMLSFVPLGLLLVAAFGLAFDDADVRGRVVKTVFENIPLSTADDRDMNGQHLSRTTAIELEPVVTPLLVAAGLATATELAARRDWYLALIDLLKVRARTIGDIVPQAVPYFAADIRYEDEAVRQNWKDTAVVAEVLRATRDRLAAVEPWTPDAMERTLRTLAEERGVAAGKIFQPLRVALTGMSVSSGIFEVLGAMGRELALRRLDKALRWLDGGAAPSAVKSA